MPYTLNMEESFACNCIGPQNGEPLCPCMMRGVEIVNGRYIKKTDLGPVEPQLGAAKDILKEYSWALDKLGEED